MKMLAWVAGLALLAGCQNLPAGLGPLLTGLPNTGPVIQGSVTAPQANLRVGLLAQPQAGGARVELVSAPASNGTYALQLVQPGINLLESDESKSFVFALTPYVDINGNGHYDDGIDQVQEGGGASFRWFAADGPSNKAGWNVYDASSGSYSQSFATAYNL